MIYLFCFIGLIAGVYIQDWWHWRPLGEEERALLDEEMQAWMRDYQP